MLAMQVNHSSLVPSFAPCSSALFLPHVRSFVRSFARSFARSLTCSLAHISFSRVLRTSLPFSPPFLARSLSLSPLALFILPSRPGLPFIQFTLSFVALEEREKATCTLHRIPAAASRASSSRPACILSLALLLAHTSLSRNQILRFPTWVAQFKKAKYGRIWGERA